MLISLILLLSYVTTLHLFLFPQTTTPTPILPLSLDLAYYFSQKKEAIRR